MENTSRLIYSQGGNIGTSTLKALLAHEFYQDHKTVVRQEIFSDEANKIKRCLDKAHDDYERDLTESELEAVFYTSTPR